jgi:hypothetical protein
MISDEPVMRQAVKNPGCVRFDAREFPLQTERR